MGLFNFSKYNDIEKALLDQHSQMMSMVGMSSTEAKKMAGNMLDRAIEESKKEGTYYLPQNLGDIIFGDAESDNQTIRNIAESIRQELSKKKGEGAKEEDIRWWWNLSDVERHFVLKQDEVAQLALFTDRLEKGDTFDKAMEKVRKYHPFYGDPSDTKHASGTNRPLPYELKNRVNIYIEKRARKNSVKYKEEIEQYSSFNALVRKEIKAGNL